MKNDKAVIPKAKEKKGIPENKSTENNAAKFKSAKTNGNSITSAIRPATEKFKARSGKLADEGTVVSYEEE